MVMCLKFIKYITHWWEHNFAHMALRSQDKGNAVGGYESLVTHIYFLGGQIAEHTKGISKNIHTFCSMHLG